VLRRIKKYWDEAAGAVLPITLVVIALQLTVARLQWTDFVQFLIGLAFVLGGMFVFLLGSDAGLEPLGRLLGSSLPTRSSALFFLIASFLIGFAITVAEPDVRVLASQFADVSGGAVSKTALIAAIALGVGSFVALGMYRIVKGTPIRRVLTIGYAALLVLGFITPNEYLPISFDSGGVTTGPMTVPLILTLAAGAASVLEGRSAIADGFGLVGLASLGPIAAVMILGVMLR
jgi:hypothetical protein